METKLSDLRKYTEFLKEKEEIFLVQKEVDPIYEVAGISKSWEGGPVVLFENIKGYPHARIITNIFPRRDLLAQLFDVSEYKQIKFALLEKLKKLIPPKVVDSGPCQEVVITENIDVLKVMPIIKHTEKDAGFILGGGNTFIYGPDNATHIGFNRMNFRGKDWSSLSINLGTHVEYHVLEARKEKTTLPLTINIGTPPAVLFVAGAGFLTPISVESDELAIAGAIQGAPVEICKAKTVDAYSIANSEWVIEGYVDTSEKVWESKEAETLGDDKTPFFPEYTGYMGRARQTYKFKVTAITHRKDKPILYAPLAHSFSAGNLVALLDEVILLQAADRICPGLVRDVNVLKGFCNGGVVVQVKKRRRRDEGYQRNIIHALFTTLYNLQVVIAVDEDIDIYSAEDVWWAVTTRVDPLTDIITYPSMRGADNFPLEKLVPQAMGTAAKLGIDATVPYPLRWKFELGKYPEVDLTKWFTKEEITKGQNLQDEYAKILVKRRN